MSNICGSARSNKLSSGRFLGQASECKVAQGKSWAGTAALVYQTINFYSIVSTGQGARQHARRGKPFQTKSDGSSHKAMTSKDYLVEKILSGAEIWNQWRAQNPQPDELDLTQVNLSGANLRGIDLNQASLIGANLSGADLREAKMYAACLREANLRGAILSGAILNGAFFVGADLSGANLSCADLRSATFLTNDPLYKLSRSQYDPILLAMRKHFSLKTDLMNANLHKADLRSAQLQDVFFKGANLSDALLTGAEMWRTNLEGADLSGADLRRAFLVHTNLRHTIINRKTKINDRWRRISFLLSDKVTKPFHWEGAALKYADLAGVDLSGALLPYADLRGANLTNANLIGASLDKGRTSDADLEGAKYSRDTVLPVLSQLQLQSMILVDPPPLQPHNQEVLVDLGSVQDERKRTNVFRVRRKDQQKFRDMLLDAFQGKCAITSCDVEGALDAAHIFPYRGSKTDFPWNGILLRLDFHRLFDRYLLTIDAQTGRVYLSPSLMNSYVEYANTTVCFPEQPVSLNRQQALRWHNAQCSWLA